MLKDRINEYVANELKNHHSAYIKDPKIIHDSILGSNIFLPHEICVLDTPIVQRLRRISQVDLVPLVFPSGNHNRFEHTLGVTTLSGRLVNALYNRDDFHAWAEDKGISLQYALNHVRMAAILHDCGHGPFSHVSEEFLLEFPDFVELRNSDIKFNSVSKHEIMSYLIARSPALKEFFHQHLVNEYKIEIDLDFVSDIIIGHTAGYTDQAFLVDVINGAFDADKLDYIQRDSHCTGIKMVLDVDRLFHTINATEVKGIKRLTVDMSGVSTLEQIIFSKMMLFCTVYQHHKVRAAECLLKSILSRLIEVEDFKKQGASCLLGVTDADIYGLHTHKDLLIASWAKAITNRNLPKRAFVMSGKIIKDWLDSLMDRSETWGLQRQFAEAIAEISGLESHEIWVDIKKEPNFNEASLCAVRHTRVSAEWTELSRIFPIDAWITSFSENKWKAFVFTWPKNRDKVFRATVKLLAGKGIPIDENAARLECKMEDYQEEVQV